MGELTEEQIRRNIAIYLRRISDDIERGRYNKIEIENMPISQEINDAPFFIGRIPLGFEFRIRVLYDEYLGVT